MAAPLPGIGRNVRHRAVDQPVANGVEHCLMLGHRVDDTFRVFRARKGEEVRAATGGVCRNVLSAQAVERVLPVMDRPVLA